MALGTNDIILHIKRLIYSSIRLAYQCACDYPIVLGAGILLLFLHRLCPSLFNFLLSSSPVFLLTALLLGALLSYDESVAPIVGENQQALSLKSKISITNCSIDKVETVAVEEHLDNTTTSNEVYVREKTYEGNMHRTQCEEKNGTYMTIHTVLIEEICTKDGTSDYDLQDTHHGGKNVTYMETNSVPCMEPSSCANRSVTVETEEHIGENNKKVELQELGNMNLESDNSKVQYQYQLGEFMSSCWEPVMRREPQDTCSDSESDLTESSPDASMTDIIPMLEELHPLIDLQTSHPFLASKDDLNTSSDDEEDDLEEDASTYENGSEGKKDDGNNWEDVIDLNYLDMDNNSKMDSLMDLQRAKNILKFELDKRLMDLQADDAVQKMEAASRFHVQVPSIFTSRQIPFGFSNGSDEIIELPHLPDSAPSSLLPRKNLCDFSVDKNMAHDIQLQETWTPHSYFSARGHRQHGNLYVQHSTSLHHNCFKLEKDEISKKDAQDSQLDSEGYSGKLFGSLEKHIGEEIKILNAAISDVGVLEVNHEMDEGNRNADSSDDINSSPIQKYIQSTSEEKDPIHAGIEQLILSPPYKINNSDPHIIEGDSIGEFNSLFKCRMLEVLEQSISESSVSQPLTVKLEDELSEPLSSESGTGTPVIDGCSIEDMDQQFAQLNDEALAASDPTCHNEPIQEKPSEALLAGNGHYSELHHEGSLLEFTFDPPVLSVKKSTTDSLPLHTEQPGCFSVAHILEESSVEDIAVELEGAHDQVETHGSSVPTVKHSNSSSCQLHVFSLGSTEEESCLIKQQDNGLHMRSISDATIYKPTTTETEEGTSN
uniref:Uncharacterized protein n=1 Tax=Oryza brachyantha TaxID=4533 RepID=J3NB26_ORYBR